MEVYGEPEIVLVHDWLTGMRGGERCLEALCRRWPRAPLFTLLHDHMACGAGIVATTCVLQVHSEIQGDVEQ